jgi:hypothetical protein
MKHFQLLPLLLLTALPAVSTTIASSDVVGDYIRAHAARAKADEYAEARKIVRGDVNGDRIPDTVALYTLEGMGGGNSHVQYLAVFLGRRTGPPQFAARTEAGGKNQRSVELDRVSGGKILVSTKSYRSSDASCCPTRAGKARYRLAGRRLVER